jgi:hypothetical protein
VRKGDAVRFLSCPACSPQGICPEMKNSITLLPSAFYSRS